MKQILLMRRRWFILFAVSIADVVMGDTAVLPSTSSDPITVEDSSSVNEEELPPQESAQAAAQHLSPWRPFDPLCNWLGITPPPFLSFEHTQADMRLPGPDFTNFPNSAFTVPKNSVYLEFNPGGFSGASRISGSQWGWPYLFRYGATNEIELRLLSSGLTVESGATGFSPIAFDTKIHLAQWMEESFNMALGIEAAIQTSSWLASPAFKGDTQYSLQLLVDHFLPLDIAFEWNVGFTYQTYLGQDTYLPVVEWAFQRNVTDEVSVYVNGSHSALPSEMIREAGYSPNSWPQQQLIGAGAQWSVNRWVAFFGGYNWGITRFSPAYMTTIGFSVSF